MIKTIIFDFDGTIADTIPFTFKKIIEINKRLKITSKTDNEIIDKLKKIDYRDLLKEFRIDWFKMPIILWEIKKAQKELYFHLNKIKVFPGIKTLLKNLNQKNISCYIYSSNIKNNIEKFLEMNDLRKYFKKIYVGTNLLGKAKNLLEIIKKEKLEKEETVYVADEVRDVLACKKIGLKIISVIWGLNEGKLLKKIGADFIVDKPNEILVIANQLSDC